ncbi:hypothetical protein HPB51_001489 [Rhipicephalus microplus]|uniref:Uncharacterized protein n=1 Tax=Rhipicephalus microplus TaxID=6941 RepID=A0A9J6EW11_RHIMP|nr:hypothetical protein HPB51_001489 [Rhipicephalus microplus]
MMDYIAWKRRPTPQLLAMLRAHALDSEDEEDPARLLDTRPPSALLAAATVSSAAADDYGRCSDGGSRGYHDGCRRHAVIFVPYDNVHGEFRGDCVDGEFRGVSYFDRCHCHPFCRVYW